MFGQKAYKVDTASQAYKWTNSKKNFKFKKMSLNDIEEYRLALADTYECDEKLITSITTHDDVIKFYVKGKQITTLQSKDEDQVW